MTFPCCVNAQQIKLVLVTLELIGDNLAQASMQHTLIDLTGKKFGRLTVVSRAENDKRGRSRWVCTCTCGSQKVISGSKLRHHEVRSCGCLFRELRESRQTKFERHA
jgi:hypothetical protein